MTKSPFLNAAMAALYIIAVATLMNVSVKAAGPREDTILVPIAMLSLFTLSAAVMGYLFLSQPLQMYLDGQKKKGVTLFLQTVGVFAGITAIALILAFSGII